MYKIYKYLCNLIGASFFIFPITISLYMIYEIGFLETSLYLFLLGCVAYIILLIVIWYENKYSKTKDIKDGDGSIAKRIGLIFLIPYIGLILICIFILSPLQEYLEKKKIKTQGIVMNDKKIKEIDLSLFKTNPNLEFEKCKCSCHNSKFNVMHFMPCCNICKYCEQRINILSYDDHIEVCKKIAEENEKLFS